MSIGRFLLVFGLGFAVSAFLGFVAQRILLARTQRGAYRRPQRVTMETKLTPLEVIRNSIVAGCRYFFWLLVLVLGLGFFVWLIIELFPAL